MERPTRLQKDHLSVAPNLPDYEAARRRFDWSAARAGLEGLPDGALNIAHEAVMRHARSSLRGRRAFRFFRKDGRVEDVTFAELGEKVARFAGALRAIGVERGDRVFSLLGRIPELPVVAFGTLAAGAVFCPLFTAFGPEPIRARMSIGNARVLVTTASLFERKVKPLLPWPTPLVVVVVSDGAGAPPGTRDFDADLAAATPQWAAAPTDPNEMALLHFTSGTTGRPKGAVHVHEAVVAHQVTARLALDLHDDDVFWCTADAGWVTGTSYGLIAPATLGVTSIVDEEEFDPDRWLAILRDFGVSVWYTAPTAVRMLMKAGATARPQALRFIASVGEPLNPEAVLWGVDAFGLPIHDNWWQTETGGIMIANFASMDVKPGSMGKPIPGVEAAVVARRESGAVEPLPPGVQGELALKPGWPSMFRGYLHEVERYRHCFADGWYLTGDLARVDADGYYWFVGRADDVIKSAGHLIGPFEVESALMEHPAVAEAAVIGKPEPTVGEIVKCFVSLKPGFAGGEAMARDLLAFARTRLGPAIAPREIAIVESLPRTRSGKILRRLLRAREQGLPEGDLSTLETPP